MNSSNATHLEQCLCPPERNFGAPYTVVNFWSICMAQALKFGCVLMSWVTVVAHKGNKRLFFWIYSEAKEKCCAVLHHYYSCLETGSSCFPIHLWGSTFLSGSAILRCGSSAAPDCWKSLCASQYWDNSNSKFWSQPSRSRTLKTRSAGLNFIRGCTERITGVKQYLHLPPGE